MRFIFALTILCFFLCVVCDQSFNVDQRQLVATVTSAVSTVTSDSTTAASAATSDITTAATTAVATVTSDTATAASAATSDITTAASTVTSDATSVVSTAVTTVTTIASTATTGLTSAITTVTSDLTSVVTSVTTDVTSIVTTATTGLTSVVTTVTTELTSAVTSVTSQVTTGVNALTSAGSTLTSAIGTIASSATSALTSATTSTAGCSGFDCQCSSRLNATVGRAICSSGGKWVIDSSAVNDDTLVIGSSDTLTINGDYTSTDDAELTIYSSGKNKGPIITITGHAHLSGTLNIDLTAWTEDNARRSLFAPLFARESTSTNITLIQAGSISGQFSSVKTKVARGSCQTATPSYTSTTVLIGVSPSNKCGNNKSRTVTIAVTASVVGFFIIAAIVITLALYYGIRYRPRRFNKLFVSGTSRIDNDEF